MLMVFVSDPKVIGMLMICQDDLETASTSHVCSDVMTRGVDLDI